MQVTRGLGDVMSSSSGGGYAVGVRIFRDRGLLRQICDELRHRVMDVGEIARLENVSPELLIRVVEADLARGEDPSWPLRRFADKHTGFTSAAWLTSRGRLSRRHILNSSGTALCGIRVGLQRELLDSGPCHTCAERAGVEDA